MIFAIIADDLTGSNDSGVQFTKKGLTSSVFFDIADLDNNINSDVVIFDTDSRGLTKKEAYTRVHDAAKIVNNLEYKHLYKKIDSTLRGNIGAEIDAVLDEIKVDFAIIAPAFPAIGRTTIRGKHFLNGKPINETEISRDPKSPVLEASIKERLQLQSKREIGNITLEDLYLGRDHLLQRLEAFKAQKVELVVFDVETENDLVKLVQLIDATSYHVLWVGSAGLAEALVNTTVNVNNKTETDYKSEEGSVLVVAGSLSNATKQQVDYMRNRDGIVHVELNPVLLFSQEKDREMERCESIIIEEIQNGNDVVLYSGNSKEQVAGAIEKGKQQSINKIEVSDMIADSLGKMVKNVMKHDLIAGLVLTGGDTAKAVAKNIHVNGMELVRELETGIPFGYLIGSHRIPAVTKAGAFGKEDSLFNARNFLKGDAINE